MKREQIIEYLERKIKVCHELGGMEREKATYQSVLKFVRSLTQQDECIHQWQEVWKDNNHQSSWGTNRCMKCGEEDTWQYDSPIPKYES